ncbi:PQQ-binding-like beta-propeller repeat protein [Streptomyces sp. ITFR-6]|uniref:outer membrane protein assembly factor BamB family protein n=1 Tax=Streptomyces sp. ITFR-6 TaxID=3075197 RepID=UPI002889F168|nr:PQQ-binding-like beta-propeller repeat protein [Streptomyces sp. ITFR-6]WNI29023.1 PQQ-binding-like beta-propeller repeat protein [Streptomyces sp. ITFR-6]
MAWKIHGGESDGSAVPAPPERRRVWTYAMDGAAAGVSRLGFAGGSLYATAEGPLSEHAVSARSGRGRWVAGMSGGTPGESELGPVTVAGGSVYAVVEGGHVRALAAADGVRRRLTGPLGGGPPAAPVAVGTTLCALMRTQTAADETGGSRTLTDGVLCGLDAASKRVRWRAGGHRLLLADRSRGQLIADARGGDGLSALDADSGARRWSLPGQDTVVTGPELLYATGTGTADEVSAYELSTGRRRWRSAAPPKDHPRTPGAHLGLSADGRTVHACDGGTGAVYAYDAMTGDRRWRITIDSPVVPAAAAAGSAVFLASASGFRASHRPGGYLTARSAADGGQLWRTDSGDGTSVAAAARGTVLVAHGAQTWAYDAGSGAARRRVTGGPGAGDAPLTADGRLYVVTDAGIGAVTV